ncbi:hypothetical protein D6745_02300 [Candidatus Woesearchaeota archaeon]|nr:MAG: hypothetical protein D6745_02300 [Candidatus Woesearchaeota archaeon]
MPKKGYVSEDEYNKLKKWYEEALAEKDKKIKELEEKNLLLLKTALKQSEHAEHWAHLAHRLEGEKKKRGK